MMNTQKEMEERITILERTVKALVDTIVELCNHEGIPNIDDIIPAGTDDIWEDK